MAEGAPLLREYGADPHRAGAHVEAVNDPASGFATAEKRATKALIKADNLIPAMAPENCQVEHGEVAEWLKALPC